MADKRLNPVAASDESPVVDTEPPPKQSIWAAGCVIFRMRDDGKHEYLIVHRPRYDDWSLPKGKLDKRETFLDGAVREVYEETGFVAKKPRLVGTVGYHTTNGNPKVVRWWVGRSSKGTFTPNKEVDAVKWVRFKKGQRLLDYRNDREVLDRANDMVLERSAGVIYLIRHASAGNRSPMDPDDWSRGLDKRGIEQRRWLTRLLQAHPITRIGSSDYTRCRETVRPLSERLGIPLEFEPALVEGSHPHRMISLIHELQEEAAILCSHGDVIESVVGSLFASGIPMQGPMKWKKGSVWELRTISGRVVSGRYLPPHTEYR